jgi:hypothetical protein
MNLQFYRATFGKFDRLGRTKDAVLVNRVYYHCLKPFRFDPIIERLHCIHCSL